MSIYKIIAICACAVSASLSYAENETVYNVDKDIIITYKNNSDQILNNNKAVLHIDNKSNAPIIVEIDKKGRDNIIETPDPAVVVPSGSTSDVDIKVNLDAKKKARSGSDHIVIKATKIYGNMSAEDKSQTKMFVKEIKI